MDIYQENHTTTILAPNLFLLKKTKDSTKFPNPLFL